MKGRVFMNKKTPLLIGWSEVSITPEKKIRLKGQFYERISQYVETPITVTAMAVESSGDQMIICSVDIESIDICVIEAVRKRLSENNKDIDPNKVIMAATHSHNSFDYEGTDPGLNALAKLLGDEEKKEEHDDEADRAAGIMTPKESTQYIIDKIYDAVCESWANRKETIFAHEFGRAAVGMCRRVCYSDGTAKMWGEATTPDFTTLEGGNDNGIELIYVYDTNKKLTGIVANIACPSQVLEQRYFISSDYWGKVKILLRREFGEDLKVLGLCSPAGDQCPRDLVRWVEPETPVEDPNIERFNLRPRKADPSMYDIKGSWTIGRRIATEIKAIYEDITDYYDEAELEHRVIEMQLPLRRVSEEDNRIAREAIEEFKELRAKNPAALTFKDNARMHVHAGTAIRYDRQQKESIVPTEVHIAKFGDVAFATSPFELFLDFANEIRARSYAEQTFLVQLACGTLGYVPTAKAEKGGHYSAYVSSGNVGHEGGKMLVENTLSVIEEMFNK